MPKIPTFPDCFDEVKRITISDLRRLGFLKKGCYESTGSIRWTRAGSPSGSVSATVTRTDYGGYLKLDYLSNGEPISYRINVEARPSNLGFGEVLYFVCPVTGARCRILYGIGRHFLSRKAYPSAMYSTQTQSKRWRDFSRVLGTADRDDLFHRRYSRTHYKGKPTRRFRRWLAVTERRETAIMHRGLIEKFLAL